MPCAVANCLEVKGNFDCIRRAGGLWLRPVCSSYPAAVPKSVKKLNERQKRHLRQLAHSLKPLVIIGGNGLTEGVVNEIDQTIAHHELIKVRVNALDREERDAMIAAICEALECALVQRIGHIAVLYREAEKPVIRLP